MKRAAKIAFIAALMLGITVQAFAGEVVVAAASDLSSAIREIAAVFEKNTKHTVKLTLSR